VSRDGTRPWSRWLRGYRDDRDLTQEELGELLGVDGKTVSAWENGQRPGRRHARTICARLRTTRAELGLVESPGGPVLGRRDFFRLSAGAGSLALFGRWAGVERVDLPGVEGFESATELLQRLWMRVGAAAALGPALGHVESLTRLLQGSLPAAARPRLCAALAESAALLAICKSWIGDPDGADHFAAAGLDAARETGDRDLAAHVLLARAWSDRRLVDRPGERLRRAAEAGAAAPATRAWATALAAGASAELGRSTACLAFLDDAAGLVAGGAGRRYPWPDPVWLAGERAVCLARLRRAAEARRALDEALAGSGDERAADRLRWTLAAARVHVQEGDREAAARVALDVLRAARPLRHRPVEDEVDDLRATLPPSGGPAALALEREMGSR
jgi:transcriptional regulator with XRE-family HTH domain